MLPHIILICPQKKPQKKSDARTAAPTAAPDRKRQDPQRFIAIHVQTQDGPELLNISFAMSDAILKTYHMLTEYPDEIKDASDVEAGLKLLIMSKRAAAASAATSTEDNQAMVDQSPAGPSAASAEDMPSGDDLTPESETPAASRVPGWSLISTVKSVVSKPFEFFGGANQDAGPSNADDQSGSPSKIPNTPTPANRVRRGDPLKRRALLNKGKGKASAVPLRKVNEFEEHSQNFRGKQRESMVESTADEELPHNSQSVPADLYKQPQRVRRRDKDYYERKYAVPPIDPLTGNYVRARTFYAVPYPPSSDEDSSSDEDFETGLPKGPRLYVMQVDKTEKERLETEREEKERLVREAEEKKKRLAEEARLEKERLEDEAAWEKQYLELMPHDLDDLYLAHPDRLYFKKSPYAELRMARRYEKNESLPGQAYPSEAMKRFLVYYHKRRGTEGAFMTGEPVYSYEERVERRKRFPPPPAPEPKVWKPIRFGTQECKDWQVKRLAELEEQLHKQRCYGCEKCGPRVDPLLDWDPWKKNKDTGDSGASASSPNAEADVNDKEKDVGDSGASASTADTKGEANVNDKEKVIDKEKEAAEKEAAEKEDVEAFQLNRTSEKEENAFDSNASASSAIANGETNVVKSTMEVTDKEIVAQPSDMQSFFDMARRKTPAKNVASEAQTPTTNATKHTATFNNASVVHTPITNAAPETQTPTTIHAHGAQITVFNDEEQVHTPAINYAQQAQLEAIRQQVLKHQPQVPSKLGMSPLFQSPLQPNPFLSSPLQYNSPQSNPLNEIQANERWRSSLQLGGLLSRENATTQDNDMSEIEGMPEVDPNEQEFIILPGVRNIPPREVV